MVPAQGGQVWASRGDLQGIPSNDGQALQLSSLLLQAAFEWKGWEDLRIEKQGI